MLIKEKQYQVRVNALILDLAQWRKLSEWQTRKTGVWTGKIGTTICVGVQEFLMEVGIPGGNQPIFTGEEAEFFREIHEAGRRRKP